MTYKQAVRLRNDLIGMIGEFYEKRMISDVVIAPVDEDEYRIWAQDYLRNENQDNAVVPFLHSDLKVLFVYEYNSANHKQSGTFIHGNVLVDAKDFGVDIDRNKYK
jgi:hypothetical protein